jgi:hypothetical protein
MRVETLSRRGRFLLGAAPADPPTPAAAARRPIKTSNAHKQGAAIALLVAAGTAQAGSAPAAKPDNKGFFQRLATDLSGVDPTAQPDQPGQPNQSCEDSTTRPGQAQNAPGSAFNPDGKAGTVYAGEQPQNSKNPKSVSQYDVACFNVSNQGH